MSSKAGKMEKQILKQEMPEQKTKTMVVGVDINISDIGIRTAYVIISGVPEDLPEEYEATVLHTAEGQFVNALNERKFLEFYDQGKSAKDQNPTYVNLNKVDFIKVEKVYKVK